MLAKEVVKQNRMAVSQACQTFCVSETCYHDEPILTTENQLIAGSLIELTEQKRNWGFGLCFLYFRNVKGHTWNHKRVYRIYRELSLNLLIKPYKRLKRDKPIPKILTNVGQWILCITS